QREQRERVVEGPGIGRPVGEQRRALGLLGGLARGRIELTQLHERPVATGEHEHREARFGIVAHDTRTGRALREELLGALDGQLVGRELGRDRRLLVTALEARAVVPYAYDDLATVGVE